MDDNVAISLEGVWKEYTTGLGHALKRIALNRAGLNRAAVNTKHYWALKDINLDLKKGQSVGIVGRNGAGKSTLLKVIAGILEPSLGNVRVNGSLFPMIEINAGLHFELTGRENAKLLCLILETPKREINHKIPEIEEFSELGPWFDKPIRMYSSGMLARLGFSVAANIRRDIVLIDETFAVGDLRFRNKGLARLNSLRKSGATILIVSHNIETLRFVAEQGALLDNGELKFFGSSHDTLKEYEKLAFTRNRGETNVECKRPVGSGKVTILDAEILDDQGNTLVNIDEGSRFKVKISLGLRDIVNPVLFCLGIYNEAGTLCSWNNSAEAGVVADTRTGDLILTANYENNVLASGAYEIVFLAQDFHSYEIIERVAGLAGFSIIGENRTSAVISFPCNWSIMNRGDKDKIVESSEPETI